MEAYHRIIMGRMKIKLRVQSGMQIACHATHKGLTIATACETARNKIKPSATQDLGRVGTLCLGLHDLENAEQQAPKMCFDLWSASSPLQGTAETLP